jgi:hypothetical protein
MLATVIGASVLSGLFYNGLQPKERFENPYYPTENGDFEKLWRQMPFGFVKNQIPGKIIYNNPLPYRAVNEFVEQLNETNWGYATKLSSRAVATNKYRNLLDTKFSKEVYPRMDLTRQDPTKGRHRRRQYSFYINQ